MVTSLTSELFSDGWINGVAVSTMRRFAVTDPATQQTVAHVADLDSGDAVDAIDAAAAALPSWRTTDLSERIATVVRWADEIDRNTDALAEVLCLENGKPMPQARGEIAQCASLLRWFAECADRLNGETLSSPEAQRNYTIKQAIGVVAVITPWNFPAAAIIVKAGAAIVVGNTVIAKPSEETPLIALALARLSAQAGLPAGVFNVVTCSEPADVGQAICSSPQVRMLSFTGSTSVGRSLYAACGETVKRIALELGGNAPFIVFDDADLNNAIEGAVGARCYNSGQICVGANRFFVHAKIHDEFVAKLSARFEGLVVGSGHDDSSEIGPLINMAAIERISELVADAERRGAVVCTGGRPAKPGRQFFQPTVLAGMTTDMLAYETEIFGPIACLYRFDDADDVLAMANDTPAGLSAYVYSANSARLAEFAERLEAGVIGINSSTIFANNLPFGGIKQSGIGREHGRDCLNEYVEVKSICERN